jgi:hypothetical protein
MTRKIMLYIVILLLLVISGALVTGQFDIDPLLAVFTALAIIVVAAFVIRKKRK